MHMWGKRPIHVVTLFVYAEIDTTQFVVVHMVQYRCDLDLESIPPKVSLQF